MYLPRQVLWYQQLASGSSTSVATTRIRAGQYLMPTSVSGHRLVSLRHWYFFAARKIAMAHVHICNNKLRPRHSLCYGMNEHERT